MMAEEKKETKPKPKAEEKPKAEKKEEKPKVEKKPTAEKKEEPKKEDKAEQPKEASKEEKKPSPAKDEKEERKILKESVHTIPLRKAFDHPRTKRAKYAAREVKRYVEKHTRKPATLDPKLNEALEQILV